MALGTHQPYSLLYSNDDLNRNHNRKHTHTRTHSRGRERVIDVFRCRRGIVKRFRYTHAKPFNLRSKALKQKPTSNRSRKKKRFTHGARQGEMSFQIQSVVAVVAFSQPKSRINTNTKHAHTQSTGGIVQYTRPIFCRFGSVCQCTSTYNVSTPYTERMNRGPLRFVFVCIFPFRLPQRIVWRARENEMNS